MYVKKYLTCANIFSFDSFFEIFIKHDDGNIIQIATPIVDPSNPITNSIEGIKSPMIIVNSAITIVIHRNLGSGI